jgi:hypothetical protein
MEKSKAESRGQTFTRSLFCKGKPSAKEHKGDLLRNDYTLSGFIDDEEDKKNYFMEGFEHDALEERGDSDDILGENDEDDF